MPGPARVIVSLFVSCLALGAQSAPGLQPPVLGHLVAAGTPLQFVANVGQWDRAVGLAAVGGATAAWIVGDGFVQRFERTARAARTDAPAATGGAIVRTRFVGGAGNARGAGPLAAKHSFLRGTRSWSAPAFASARLDHLLPGVDLAFHAAASGELEYDLVLAPGADLAAVVAECEGAKGLAITADGALAVEVPLPGGQRVTLRHQPPVAWQDTPAGRVLRQVRFRLLGGLRFGFASDDLDPAQAAVLDPGLVWSTLLGGGSSESVNAVQWLPGQGIWLGGYTGSTDFPTTVGVFQSTGGHDGFVARLTEDGTSLVWATYVGGGDNDEVRGIAVDASLTVAAVGMTHSVDFPTVAGALQSVYSGGSLIVDVGDAFCIRLSADGSALLGGTYLGGFLDEVAEAVHVAADGDLVVAGWTSSPDFPTTPGSLQPHLGGPVTLQSDGFVTRLSADTRTRVWSTYLGGFAPEQLVGMHLDALDQATVLGYSVSSDYPTTAGAFATTSAGGNDIVVSRLSADGSALVWSTYLGGTSEDIGMGLDVAADGSVWVGGSTRSSDFPLSANAPQRTLLGRQDGFLAQLSDDGRSLLYSTLIGGPADDSVRAISCGAGQPFFVGETGGGLPVTTGAPQAQFGGGSLDGYAAELAPDGASFTFCTYLGGGGDDYLLAAARAVNGTAVVGGFTFSSDFPVTAGVLQTQLRGVQDGVVAKFDLVSSVNGFLRVGSGESPPTGLQPGTVADALALTLENATDRRLTLQSVRVAIAGVGDDAQLLDGVSLWRDDPGQPGTRDVLLAGPVPFARDDGEVVLPLTALPPLEVGVTVHLTLALHARSSVPAGSEFALAVVGNAAWQVAAEGAGSPHLAIEGAARNVGPILRVGAAVPFPGDADGDGQLTVADLRRLCLLLGQPAQGVDPDGDGSITVADLLDLRDCILGRSIVQGCPAVVTRGSWVALRGWFANGSVPQVTLGGIALGVGAVTSREFTARIDEDLPLGDQELVVTLVDGRSFVRRVAVQ